jgi:hypothetical protein
MHKPVTAFYHDPPIWVGESPVDHEAQPPSVSFNKFNNEVVRHTFEGGIELRVSVEGLFAFDFTNWAPAHIRDNKPNMVPNIDAMVDAAINRRTS